MGTMETNDINILEVMINLHDVSTNMPLDPKVALKMYRRANLKNNFSSGSLMGGYMSHDKDIQEIPLSFPIKRKYI